jgi:Ca2+-binding EF-hand superfamily protein
MQLYVAVLLDNFDFVTTIEEGSISVDAVVQFKSTFRAFDVDNVGSIPAVRLLTRFRDSHISSKLMKRTNLFLPVFL